MANATPVSFPSGFVPFSSIYYISGLDTNGNRLVEGNLVPITGIAGIESISPGAPNQQFSDALIQLAPGLYFSNVYVPTAAELQGNFQALAFLVFDPLTGNPFTGAGDLPFIWDIIPQSRLSGLFAFEIGSSASTATPEPGSWLLLASATALLGAGALAQKRLQSR